MVVTVTNLNMSALGQVILGCYLFQVKVLRNYQLWKIGDKTHKRLLPSHSSPSVLGGNRRYRPFANVLFKFVKVIY